jgi:hypothetical protein
MKKLGLAAICAVVLIFVVGASTPAQADTLEVLPTDHDFGDVEVGTTVTTIVSMTNINGSDVEVYGLGFQAGGSDDYTVANAPPLPFIVVPGQTVEVVVSFSPSADGYVTAVLQIESTDSVNPVQEVFLGGVGVGTQPEPVSMQAILDFFDASVAAGTLDGTALSEQARKAHLKVFRFILVAAGTLIDGGYYDRACPTLERAYIRSDGLLRPKDFIQGDALAELNGMIGQLMADLGCQ